MTTSRRIHVGIALDGAGWHPSAWREHVSRPTELFTGPYWQHLAQEAERGQLDFLTIDDSFGLQSAEPFDEDDRTDEVRGRLDAVLIASRIAPATTSIGLLPVATTTHTEPFHVAAAIATLDHIGEGRGGWQARVSALQRDALLTGRREIPALTGRDDPAATALTEELFEEASAVVDVARQLWDSWEDDAEIRDRATDRFLDREKVHRIDAETPWFSVRGPSTVPRPPQGHPVVTALAHAAEPYRFAARSADLVFVTPQDTDDARRILREVRGQESAVGREGERLRVLADLVVLLDGPDENARARLARLDALGRPLTSDARIVAGSASALADVIEELAGLGYDGVRLRPAVALADLPRVADDLVPELRRRGRRPDGYEAGTLRGLLGLPESVPNRFATAPTTATAAPTSSTSSTSSAASAPTTTDRKAS
ncbi:LLM class flavin-dependent oxidoreductase [Brachybacterium sp. AOP43-C2-M15]|uniref:LLM class flavin-dependent oxidoreductase n=1 Tax=Brachybacterium sp. AOP43-C2-M15 TaxID=3457661 RepID=UPI00403430D5